MTARVQTSRRRRRRDHADRAAFKFRRPSLISSAQPGATASANNGSFAVERNRVSRTPCLAAISTSSNVLAPYSIAPPRERLDHRRAAAQVDDLYVQALGFEEPAGLSDHIGRRAQQLAAEPDADGSWSRHRLSDGEGRRDGRWTGAAARAAPRGSARNEKSPPRTGRCSNSSAQLLVPILNHHSQRETRLSRGGTEESPLRPEPQRLR